MSNIIKELSLNKHPKDCKDLSLINARNIVVSNDFSCLQNELSIVHHSVITNYLQDKVLVGYIPCNDEIVLITCPKDKFGSQDFDYAALYCTIARYKEGDENVQECLDNFVYHYGTITGTFTYNVQGNLIVAIAETNPSWDQMVPLRTINLGKYGEGTKGTDRELSEGLHALSPELKLPKLSDFTYIPGSTYKGWYYFFIRYKINNVDYTHWFPIGYPIFVCDTEKQSIFKYGFKEKGSNSFSISGAVDYFSTNTNISKETINIKIEDLDYSTGNKDKYKFYQIGFICVAKDSSKAFRSNDLSINTKEFTISIPEVNSYSIEELILDNYNYYNVGNVINYQNRLYISNFKEHTNPVLGIGTFTEENLSKIKLTFFREETNIKDYFEQVISVNNDGIVDSSENLPKSSSDYEYISKYPYYKNDTPGAKISSLKIGDDITFDSSLANGTYNEVGYFTTNKNNQITANLTLYVDIGLLNSTIKIYITCTISGKQYSCEYWEVRRYRCSCGDNDFDEDIEVNETGVVSGTGPLFINTNESLNKRKKDTTLIPGEIYSFYIHFVNKYGEATDGYKIPNIYGLNNVPKLKYTCSKGSISFPTQQQVLGANGLYLSGQETIQPNGGYSNQDVIDEIESLVKTLNGIPNLKWFQIPGVEHDNYNNCFLPFINDNGDILYRVPFVDFTVNNTYIIYASFKLQFDLNGFQLPEGYIGYYFSYEKFEPTIKFRGILTKRDASNQQAVTANSDREVPYNKYNGLDIDNIENVHFYSSNLDINDTIDLDFNAVYITKDLNLKQNVVSYTPNNNTKVEVANARFPANLNMPEIGGTDYNAVYGVTKSSISIAGDALKDKRNLGTSIELESSDVASLFNNNTKIYKASLVKISTNIYTNENKILIKFTDIFYSGTHNIIKKGLNGFFTYNDFIVYDFNKFVFNTTNNLLLNEKYGMYYKTDVFDYDADNDNNLDEPGDYQVRYINTYRAPLYYVQLATYDVILNEAKSFKNEPSIYYLQLEKTISDENINNQIKQFAQNVIIVPENTIDLFENKYTNQDALNPKTFTNYDKNKSYLEYYNKRVRRSNVIADESNENSWRIFPLEGYKDINENKGDITNLVGIGTTLLVHTQHSLFMFDRSNTLQTADKEVQLAMPDIFDVDYKEVFTSDLGICGLQDKFATIVDQFGYIFYDNDAHRIYKFGQGKIDNIDLDIVQFINKYKPWQIRFAHDKEANRLLVNMRIFVDQFDQQTPYYEQEVTLSYNYVLGKWISFHDYVFDRAFNTKNMLYLLIDRIEDGSRVFSDIYIINYIPNYKINVLSARNVAYNSFENIRDENDGFGVFNSRIDIICNKNYDSIKYLEYIAYKLYKINIDKGQYLPTPVEELKQPYSGHTIRVFNNEVDTLEMNILINNESSNTQKNTSIMNYKKPWWELGNWNFNYLRDKKQGNVKFPSRLYGNYFIVSFTLFDELRRIEFETLDYQTTKDKA